MRTRCPPCALSLSDGVEQSKLIAILPAYQAVCLGSLSTVPCRYQDSSWFHTHVFAWRTDDDNAHERAYASEAAHGARRDQSHEARCIGSDEHVCSSREPWAMVPKRTRFRHHRAVVMLVRQTRWSVGSVLFLVSRRSTRVVGLCAWYARHVESSWIFCAPRCSAPHAPSTPRNTDLKHFYQPFARTGTTDADTFCWCTQRPCNQFQKGRSNTVRGARPSWAIDHHPNSSSSVNLRQYSRTTTPITILTESIRGTHTRVVERYECIPD